MNFNDTPPFVIRGHDVLGEILRRDKERNERDRRGRMLGIPIRRRKIHTARLSDREVVESNLPIRQCGSHK